MTEPNQPGPRPNSANAILRLLEGDVTDVPVVYVEGREELGRLFEFSIDVAVPAEAQDHYREDTFVGEHAALTLFSPSGHISTFRGLISEGCYRGHGHSHVHYRLKLVPRLWLLSQVRNSRIFQEKRTPDIIGRVLQDRGVRNTALHFAVASEYSKRDYCVQYEESDWDFVSRLMEEEGIYFFHRDRESEAVVHFTDGPHGHFDLDVDPAVRFKPAVGAPEPGSIHEFRFVRRIRPGRVAQTDYSAVRPRVALDTTAQAADANTVEASLEVFHFPGEYRDRSLGQRLSAVRLEELRCGRVEASGRSTRADFEVGYRFTMQEHGVARYNAAYLLTRVIHSCTTPMAEQFGFFDESGRLVTASPSYSNEFEAIPADQPFRLHRRTTCPRMSGPQTAVVVGPEKDEIHTDSHGRVKVRFRWDRLRQIANDERELSDLTCWIRVSQAWAGPGYGGVTIPRIGHEVIVDFLDGDPDQPIITGRFYNGDNTVPYPLPDNKTQTGTKSRSTLNGSPSNFNEIRFEDLKDNELLFIHAERNKQVVVKKDNTESIGKNETISVGANRSKSVAANESITIGGNRQTQIAINDMLAVGVDRISQVGNNIVEAAGKSVLISAGTSITLQCGAAIIHMNQAGVINIAGTLINIAGMIMTNVTAPITTISGLVQLNSGVLEVVAGGMVRVAGGVTTVDGEPVKVNSV